MGLECLGARLVPTVGMTWGTPRSYGRNALGHASFLRQEWLGARLVPTVGTTVGTMTWGLNALGHASFLQ